MKKLIDIFLLPYTKFIEYRKYKKHLKELQKRDPHIYK